MPIKRYALAALAASVLLPGARAVGRLEAQVTTGSISGTVTTAAGQPVAGAQVQVRNSATGVSRGAVTREDGRYFVAGLEVGGGYELTVRRIGYAPDTRAGLRVSLGQSTRADFQITAQATQLSTVTVTSTAASTSAIIAPDRRGVQTNVSDTAILRLPTISRNFTDFVGLTPQVSTSGPGFSAAGANNRYNAIRIDGANSTDLFGLGSTGQPGGQAGGRSIPLEAVKEYQVLLTPFDVRQGQFAGAVINAVTKGGTNEFHGSLVGTNRNQNYSRDVPFIRQQPFQQSNYGATIGGPILRDKAFFFVSSEFAKQSQVAAGPYFGQPAGSPSPVPVGAADLARFQQILQGYGFPDPGVATQVENKNPLANVFARTDLNLSGSTRLVLRYNYAAADQGTFSRGATSLRLSNNGYVFKNRTNSPLVQLYSNFANGNYNELFAGYQRVRDARFVPIVAPQITVNNVPNPNSGLSSLVAGTENSSQGNSLDQDIFELTDNFSFSVRGGHRITLGTQNQFLKVRNLFSQNSYGNYVFGSLDSLAAGTPRTYTVGIRLGGPPDARFRAGNYGGYLQDEWTVSNRFNLQYGLRLDLPAIYGAPSTNDTITKYYSRVTSQMPARKVLLSPRFGFNYDVYGNQSLQLRGGAGLFAGTPPYVWISNQFGNSGVDTYGNFTCPNPTVAPRFTTADVTQQPTQCAGSSPVAQTPYNINTIDPNFKMPQNFRASLGMDRAIGSGLVLTGEALYNRAINGLFYRNLAVQNPTGVDRNGRLLYGDYSCNNGNPIPFTTENPSNQTICPDGRRNVAGRLNVIDLTNQSRDYGYSLTAGIQKRYADRWEGRLFYTFSHAYDVQSLTSSVALSNWQFGRVISGSQFDQSPTRSSYDQPHRIVASGTYSFPTRTDLSVIYYGQSGSPYTFAYSGDLNMDGSTGNDPIYVPKNVYDPNEIRFVAINRSGTTAAQQAADVTAQQAAFDRLINSTKCLRENRGSIIGRNACRSNWTNQINLNLTQALPSFRGQALELRVDVLNFGNLVNDQWGRQTYLVGGNSTIQPLVRQTTVGTTGSYASAVGPNGNQSNFTYNPSFQLLTSQNTASNYQIQLGLAYRF